MKFILETLIWMVLTGGAVYLFWGPSWPALGVALLISLAISLVGGNLLFNRGKNP